MPVFHSRANVSRRGHDFSHGGMTVQSDVRDCDLNLIMSRYKQTGVLPLTMLRNRKGIYADVSEFGDYKDCLMRVESAERMFMSMPSAVRARFQNSPALFLDFVSDPKNAQELIDLGLAVERPSKVKRGEGSSTGGAPAEPSRGAAGDAPVGDSGQRDR